jgi:hypothetical protein
VEFYSLSAEGGRVHTGKHNLGSLELIVDDSTGIRWRAPGKSKHQINVKMIDHRCTSRVLPAFAQATNVGFSSQEGFSLMLHPWHLRKDFIFLMDPY